MRLKRWDVLLKLALMNDWRLGAEIGVYNGATYFHLLDNAPNLSMIAVDKWAVNDPVYGDLTQVGIDFIAKARGYGERSRVLYGETAQMARAVPNGTLDFVFIDADHSEAAVFSDIHAWTPKVKSSGKVIGHDIDNHAVQRAALLSFGDIFVLPDHMWMAA